MTTDLVIANEDQAISLIDPQTGEVLDLALAESGQIAEWIDSVKDWQSRAREARRFADEELHRRLDANASWTLREGGYEIKGESPERVEYDVEALRRALESLVDADRISIEAFHAAIKAEVTFKASKRGVNALLKLGGEVAEAIKTCEVEVTRPRRITVKRS